MLRLHLAELRDSWSAWLGVVLAFVVVNAALANPASILFSGIHATRTGQLDPLSSSGYTASQGLMILMVALLAYNQRDEDYFTVIDVHWSLWPFLGANVLCVLVALLGGRKHARRASLTPPVEALREAAAPPVRRGLGVKGWLKALVPALVIIATYAAIAPIVELSGKERISNLIILDVFQIFLWGFLLSALTPVLVGPVTRAWTRLVPSTRVAWVLARSTVTARADRARRSITPVMFAIGICVAELGLGDSMLASLEASGMHLGLETGDVATFVMIAGPPLAVAFSGVIAVCSLITAASTVLPTLRARRLPENRVIARLVAE